MNDQHRLQHFELHAAGKLAVSDLEDRRIRETLKMIPADWERIVDVGCGDGRVSKHLLKQGRDVLGVDWSQESLRHFPGRTVVCDIRKKWPVVDEFDGAICCEVLEHFDKAEARKVVDQMFAAGRRGVLITVPANETLSAKMVPCPHCGDGYHVWGHCQSFQDFDEVDAMAGRTSCERTWIPGDGRVDSDVLSAWRKRLGWYPSTESSVCPNCGRPPELPNPSGAIRLAANKALSAAILATGALRPRAGWFACRYAN